MRTIATWSIKNIIMSVLSARDVLSVDTDDDENLLDLSQCSEFDDSGSVSASVFDLLDNESLLDIDVKEDLEYHRPTVNAKLNTTSAIQASRSVPRLPITAPKRPIPGPRLSLDAPREPSTAPKVSIKPLKQPMVYQRTPISAPKKDVTSPRSPITAPLSATMETRDFVAPPADLLPSSCASHDKSTVIKLSSCTSFHYVPEELPFVELPALAKKMKNQTSPRKRAFTISSDEGPTLLLETKRAKTSSDPDLRNFISSNRTCKPRSVSMTMTPLLATPQLQTSNPTPTTKKITVQSTKSRLQLTNSHSSIELNPMRTANESAVHSRVTQPLKQDMSHMTRKSIFASRPNIACYTSSGMGGFSLRHLGQQETPFSLNHL